MGQGLRTESATARAAVTTTRAQALRGAARAIAAVLLAITARCLGLTDEDLALLRPVMLVVAGVVIWADVFAPDSVRDLLDAEEQDEP